MRKIMFLIAIELLTICMPGEAQKFLDIYKNDSIVSSIKAADVDSMFVDEYANNRSVHFYHEGKVFHVTKTANIDSVKVYDLAKAPLVYLGVVGFNQELYEKPLGILDKNKASVYKSFINGLSRKDGALLYYAVDHALDMLQNQSFPSQVGSANLITFIDGLDQGSLMMNGNYITNQQYLDVVSKKISEMRVKDIPLTAYSLGMHESDATDYQLFQSNLKKLASSPDKAFEVNSINAIGDCLQNITDQIISISTKQTISLKIPSQSNGTRIRFTFNGSSATNSSMYIEGTLNFADCSLSNVTYHGLRGDNGEIVQGNQDSIFVVFTFTGMQREDGNGLVPTSDIRQYYKSSFSSNWLENSDFTSANNTRTSIAHSGAVILLVLDCSKSLDSQLSEIKNYANELIDRVANNAVVHIKRPFGCSETGEGGGENSYNKLTLLYNVGSGYYDTLTFMDGSYNNIIGTFDKNKNSWHGGNHTFNFLGMTYNGKTSTDTDDIAPMHIKGNIIGGNHSLISVKVEAPSHGLTNNDIGKVITSPNNVKFYIVQVIDTDNFLALPKETSVYKASTFETGTATYNGQPITINKVSGASLYPAACDKIQKVVVDGAEIVLTDGASVTGNLIDVIDYYNIVDFDYAKEHLRVDNDKVMYESPGDIRVENTFRFMEGMKVVVIANVTFRNDVYFDNVMFTQAAMKIPYTEIPKTKDLPTFTDSYFYVPGSRTINGYNYAEPNKLYLFKTNNITYNFNSNYWADPQKPVNRIIQISKDKTGFAVGYLPVGVGADLLHYTSTPFELRGNSGKIYPHGIDRAGLSVKAGERNNMIPAGSSYTAVLYRIPFDASAQGNGRICQYDVDYDGYKYVFVDYSKDVFDYVVLNNSLNGHPIELLEQRNAVLKNTVYDGGFYINATHVNGDSSYCVVRIKL